MIKADDSLFLIIDIQEKLVNMLEDKTISDKAVKLIKAANILEIPCVITEQYPKGLGATLEEVKKETTDKTVFFEKTSFSAMHGTLFKGIIGRFKKKTVFICGIEAHVCVYQTVADLIAEGYDVEVIHDITASRKEYEFNLSIEKMKQLGAKITSLEILLFELLQTSKHPKFKEIQALIK